MSEENVRQHTVPKVYLKHFSFKKKNTLCLYALDKRSGKLFECNIDDASVVKHFYTLKYNEDNKIWENYYANEVEPSIETTIGNLVKFAESPLINDRVVLFDSKSKNIIAGLMAVQFTRGMNARVYQEQLFEEYLPQAREQLHNDLITIPDDQIDIILEKYASDDEMKKLLFAAATVHSNASGNIQSMIAGRKWVLYRLSNGDGDFITSDNPILFLNDMTGNAKPFQNGLRESEVTVYFSISPKLMIACYHQDRFVPENRLVVLNSRKDADWVHNVNRAYYEQCNRQCFARSRDWLELIRNN